MARLVCAILIAWGLAAAPPLWACEEPHGKAGIPPAEWVWEALDDVTFWTFLGRLNQAKEEDIQMVYIERQMELGLDDPGLERGKRERRVLGYMFKRELEKRARQKQ